MENATANPAPLLSKDIGAIPLSSSSSKKRKLSEDLRDGSNSNSNNNPSPPSPPRLPQDPSQSQGPIFEAGAEESFTNFIKRLSNAQRASKRSRHEYAQTTAATSTPIPTVTPAASPTPLSSSAFLHRSLPCQLRGTLAWKEYCAYRKRTSRPGIRPAELLRSRNSVGTSTNASTSTNTSTSTNVESKTANKTDTTSHASVNAGTSTSTSSNAKTGASANAKDSAKDGADTKASINASSNCGDAPGHEKMTAHQNQEDAERARRASAQKELKTKQLKESMERLSDYRRREQKYWAKGQGRWQKYCAKEHERWQQQQPREEQEKWRQAWEDMMKGSERHQEHRQQQRQQEHYMTDKWLHQVEKHIKEMAEFKRCVKEVQRGAIGPGEDPAEVMSRLQLRNEALQKGWEKIQTLEWQINAAINARVKAEEEKRKIVEEERRKKRAEEERRKRAGNEAPVKKQAMVERARATYEQGRRMLMEGDQAKAMLKMETIPWPPLRGTSEFGPQTSKAAIEFDARTGISLFDFLFAGTTKEQPDVRRQLLRREQLKFHPDKFQQRFGARLSAEDDGDALAGKKATAGKRGTILEMVGRVARALNEIAGTL
ncbi:hypothetical protein BGZ54_003381 [Gamsiella multidivaricata]|nr:hypothetical protein BGZ54_003381 [Gamsiella multidivaricata]